MKNDEKNVHGLAPQGSVIEPNGTRLDDGRPDLSPTAGYDGHYPVQFSDESDTMFAGRVAMFEKSYASALQNAAGGQTFANAKLALEAKHKGELAELDAMNEANHFIDSPKKKVK